MTDGQRVVAVFGSAGVMIAWDYTGKELWRVNLGTLDSDVRLRFGRQLGDAGAGRVYATAFKRGDC